MYAGAHSENKPPKRQRARIYRTGEIFSRTVFEFQEPEMNRFYKYLYWDEKIPDKKKNRIRRRLKFCRRARPYYVLTLCKGADQLEIYNSLILLQPYYRKNQRLIIGIAASYHGALGLVRQIAGECYAENKNADLKKYLAEKQGRGEAEAAYGGS